MLELRRDPLSPADHIKLIADQLSVKVNNNVHEFTKEILSLYEHRDIKSEQDDVVRVLTMIS